MINLTLVSGIWNLEYEIWNNYMPSTTIVSGILLILIGIAGYIFSIFDGNTSLTALIPAAFGFLLVILGIIATSSEDLRKHLMHTAVIVGVIGFLIPTARLISQMNNLKISLAVLSQALMALVCLFYVILSIQSFVNARRNRESI
jgi:ascorbate-specific PTS system EIIC-type component UlaA